MEGEAQRDEGYEDEGKKKVLLWSRPDPLIACRR